MKLITFNVNSIAARLHGMKDFLDHYQPDIILFQEIKCETEKFSYDFFSDYPFIFCRGQKSYNGVAVLSRLPMHIISDTLFEGDDARYLHVKVGDTRIFCLYVPNGSAYPSEKFDYKLKWMNHFRHLIQTHRREWITGKTIIAGDFNTIPTADDYYKNILDPNDPAMHPEVRAIFYDIINMGFSDAWLLHHEIQGKSRYTFVDYRQKKFNPDYGMRIDFTLVSPALADACTDCRILQEAELYFEKPSDHFPVMINF